MSLGSHGPTFMSYYNFISFFDTGQLKLILDQHANGGHQHLTPFEVNSLKSNWENAKNISEMSLPYLRENDGEYYEKLKPLVD